MSVRIGKVTLKDSNLLVFSRKKETEIVEKFRSMANDVAVKLPDLDTFSIVGITRDGAYVVHYNAGSRDVEILPILVQEHIRFQIV